ncbi:hypothetical protein [Devosia sp. CAU 1758]
MYRLPLIAASLLALSAGLAMAQDAQCFQNEDYLVIAQERLDDVGTDILVRQPTMGKIDCTYTEKDGDFVVNLKDEPLWYEGLLGQYLVLTRSTGPDGDIVILDLAARQVVVDEGVGDEVSLSDASVTYWQRFEQGDIDNCPKYHEYTSNGLGAVITREQVFDVATGVATATGMEQCSATQ